MISDWLKSVAPVFQPMRSKAKPIAPCARDYALALSKLQVIVRNSDWFITLFAPVVIGLNDYFCFGFSKVI